MMGATDHESSVARSRVAWIAIAGLLLGAGWGSNQFTPMLLVYHTRLGLSTALLEALFGAYAAGLIPGLLLAGRWSDAHGRRPVGIAAAILSLLASVCLMSAGNTAAFLFAGRLLAGLGSGAAFAVGTAWLREALVKFNDVPPPEAGQRAVVAMTSGFALGPLVAGALAQWVPAPTAIPYVPHLALMLGVLAGVIYAPETIEADKSSGASGKMSRASRRRFRRLVVPVAPWVFVAPAIAFALLPTVVGAGHAASGVVITAGITSLTALTGVLIQPFARRLEARRGRSTGALPGMLVLSLGLALAAETSASRQTWLLVPNAIVLGAAYGLCLVAGLLEVQRLAPERSLGSVTAIYYAMTYTGFAAPYLLALASNVASYQTLLLITCLLAALTTGIVGCRVQQALVPDDPLNHRMFLHRTG